MSKFIPHSKVVREQVAQAVRRSEGLKAGHYVRVKVGPKIGTVLKSRALKEGLSIIAEEEFQLRAAGKFQKPVPTTGTIEGTNLEVGETIDMASLPYEQQVAIMGQPVADLLKEPKADTNGVYEVTNIEGATK